MKKYSIPQHRKFSPLSLVVMTLLLVTTLGVLASCTSASQQAVTPKKATPKPTPTATPAPSPTPTPKPTPTVEPLHILAVEHDPSKIMGVEGIAYPGVGWARVGHSTCGASAHRGSALRAMLENYHKQGIRVMLTICQGSYGDDVLRDAAQSQPDAVQCGNEQMKQDAAVSFLYMSPDQFAHFYDRCERIMHSVRPGIPIVLGSLDPHVSGADYQIMLGQVYYLDQVQATMNAIHPGSNWSWRNQNIGLIDSWHNGYPDASVNNLQGLFSFWAQQIGVDMYSLGKHLWVVEATGCFKGCGVNSYSAYDVAVSHILSLTTDVQTAMRYKVPLFYFSGRDFYDQGIYWPIGVEDVNGHPKPLRQDLSMGDKSLNVNCGGKDVPVHSQPNLLAKMYSGCTLPGNYYDVLLS